MKRKREDSFVDYFKAIKETDLSDATEYTLRTPLHNLLDSLAKDKKPPPKIIPEPKRDKTKLGAPDFKVKFRETIIGYVETKKVGENLDAVLKSDQIAKYKKLSGNIILTNYLEWIWLKNDSVPKRATLCSLDDAVNHWAKLDSDKAEKVAELIAGFLSTPPQKLADAKKLACALAVRCHDLRDFLLEELKRQEREDRQGQLHGLYAVFQKNVFHKLELKEFADAFAQTLGYGLFLAKLTAGERTDVTLENAKLYIPTNFELIRELVGFLEELRRKEYRSINWLVEEILSILNTLDLDAIHETLAFTKRQGRLFPPTEAERLLFDKDPYVYFYENFLKDYDKATRKARGVYYTPPPVVNFIVRTANDILKDTFAIDQGLADHKRVTVLDFATGTGTFLLEVLHQIFETVPEGIHAQVVEEHVLKNLYGFEYLIAPYTVAHLKLSQFLHDRGYPLQPDQRLNIYLTNTLEPIQPLANYLLPALSHEVKAAQTVKDKPILVITGNPPYSGHSKNTGGWITDLINTYKTVDGEPLGEKNSKWLQDDYVKFIRFAQWKMDKVEEGIVGIITNHSFLDNPTFRGMRQSLMKTFNRIYVLDLHGNTKKKEQTPEGDKDENVFDIEQGVAISLLVKKKGLSQTVCHADLWGPRKKKYQELLEAKKDSIKWEQLNPSKPSYLFILQDEKKREKYEQGWKATDIFSLHGVGMTTARDHAVIDFERKLLLERAVLFRESKESDKNLCANLGIPMKEGWDISKARKMIQKEANLGDFIEPVLFRPFDRRLIFYHDSLVWRTVKKVMHHMLEGENVGIITTRQTKDDWAVFATDHIIRHKSGSRYDISYLFPLYRYLTPEREQTSKRKLFNETDSFQGKERIENFAKNFRAFIDKKYKHHYGAEEIMGYIYAVLHSPRYREKYREFLKLDFPRIPFVAKSKTFEELSVLGGKLIQAHLLKSISKELKVTPTGNDLTIENPTYNAQCERLYINKTRYFAPVPQDVWDFHIGGYQVLNLYLKSRKGRPLSLDETTNVENMVNVLRFTIDQTRCIDKCWKP